MSMSAIRKMHSQVRLVGVQEWEKKHLGKVVSFLDAETGKIVRRSPSNQVDKPEDSQVDKRKVTDGEFARAFGYAPRPRR